MGADEITTVDYRCGTVLFRLADGSRELISAIVAIRDEADFHAAHPGLLAVKDISVVAGAD
jgi:hypothetical protein